MRRIIIAMDRESVWENRCFSVLFYFFKKIKIIDCFVPITISARMIIASDNFSIMAKQFSE